MITKAIVPVAGWGGRMLPATKSVPKVLFPLVDVPILQHIIDEIVASGITDVILITNRRTQAVEDYLERNFELDYLLQEKGRIKDLERLRSIESAIRIHIVHQTDAKGLGNAVLLAETLINNEPFAVILPDDLLLPMSNDRPLLSQLIDTFERVNAPVVSVIKMPSSELARYGVVDGRYVEPGLLRIENLIEKPTSMNPLSNLAIVGRYILKPSIFDNLRRLLPGKGGEVQLSDGISMLMNEELVYAFEFDGTYYDTGDVFGLFKANVAYFLADERFKLKAQEYLRNIRIDD